MTSELRKRGKKMGLGHYKSKRIPDMVYTLSEALDKDEKQLEKETEFYKKNPFQGNDNMDEADMIKFALGFVLIPIRMFLGIIVVLISITSTILSTVGKDTSQPLPDDVMRMQHTISYVSSTIQCFIFGLVVDVKGKPASTKDCSVQVWGPHSSLFDSFVAAYALGGRPSSPVAKAELASNGLMKAMAKANQTILVDRTDQKKKSQVVEEIKKRATDKKWKRPVVIFPEGTTTNRSSLIQFKAGAFQPGVPVQPCIIRWDKQDLAWSSGSRSRSRLTLRSIAQLFHVCQVEFLPVYHPSEEEIQDPILFASNVRQVMAEALAVGTNEFSFYDRALAQTVAKAKMFPSEVLDFSFVSFVDEIKESIIENAENEDLARTPSQLNRLILGDFQTLLSLFVKNSDQKKSKLSEKKFKGKVIKGVAKVLECETDDLDWGMFNAGSDGMVTFRQFASVVIKRKFAA